jgi:hypothetical protein
MTLFGATVSVIIIRKFREMKRMEDLGYAHDKFEAEMLKKKTPKDRLAEGIRAMLPTELKPYAEHVEAVCKAAPSLLTGKANQRVILIALARQAMVKHPEVIGGTRAGVQAAKARRRERREIDGKERRGPKEGRVQRMIDHLRRRQEIRRLRRMKR